MLGQLQHLNQVDKMFHCDGIIIDPYPEKQDDKHLIKTIHFTFPVTYDGESGVLFVRTNEQQVETCVLLAKTSATHED